jgi:uncharacterized protein
VRSVSADIAMVKVISWASRLLPWGGLALGGSLPKACPGYDSYALTPHPPYSEGRHKLPYQRPSPVCRTTSFAEVEQTIEDMRIQVRDPDLFRLFQNTFPNTLDTTISWHGVSKESAEEEVSLAGYCCWRIVLVLERKG